MLRDFRELCQAMYYGLSDFFPTTEAAITKAEALVQANEFGNSQFMEGMRIFEGLLETRGPVTRGRVLDILVKITAPRIQSIKKHLDKEEFEEAQREITDYLVVLPNSPTIKLYQELTNEGLLRKTSTVSTFVP